VCAETELLTHSSSIDTEARELHQPTKAGNLTATDTVLPVDLVQKYWAVVESKRTDAVTLKGKARSVWQQITAEFNTASSAKPSSRSKECFTHTDVIV